ncbi:MAG: hypothetical protein RIS17_154 [Pseudomonadota bacterium]|jgi:hypothetical protein
MRLSPIIIAALLAGPATAQLSVTKPTPLETPVTMAQGQGALLVAFRRPDGWSLGKSGTIAFARYNPDRHDMIARPKDAKKNGDTNTYWIQINSKDRKAAVEYRLMLVSAGDYVLYGASPGPAGMVMNSFCFNSVTVRVNAGEVVYFGDITPYFGARTAAGTVYSGMPWSWQPDAAQAALAGQPALQAAFKPGTLRGGASFSCSGQFMTAYDLPDLPRLPALTAEEKGKIAEEGRVAAPRGAGPNTAQTPIMVPVRQ